MLLPSGRMAVLGAAGVGAVAAAAGLKAAKARKTAARGFDLDDPPAPGGPEFGRLLESLTGSPVRPGNRVEILRNGDEIFPSMVKAIRSAQRSIDFSTYIYWTGGPVITDFGDALIERACAGVEVRILLDAVGSAVKIDQRLVERFREAGAEVEWFRPPHWYTLNKVNNRLHRRLLIIDGSVGFTGGTGVGEEWTGDAQDPDHWRETHLRVEGPAVRDLMGGFQENWAETTQRILAGPHLPELSSFEDGTDVQVTRSSATKGSTDIEELFYSAIAGARSRLWITTAFFVPPDAFVEALCASAGRGVDVQILVNGPNIDKEIVRRAGQRSYGRLLACGVRIFEYQQTMLHAKTLLIDGAWASVGSNNFSNRSLALNSELSFSLSDERIVAELEQHFRDDLRVSDEFDLTRWNSRPRRKRVVEGVTALVRDQF
ncbi:MAG: cardiolipin synthase B [Actinobacteria bacterium]|nr:cardiolipin synthase B [Actinomycetota bacterium]